MLMPYFLTKNVVLAANGTATFSHIVPNSESLEISSLRIKSTGSFNVIGIRTSDGKHYTNASPTNEIPGNFFPDIDESHQPLEMLPEPIKVDRGITFYFEIEDTSGAENTINVTFACVRDTG